MTILLLFTRGRIKELSFKIQKLRPEIILTHWDKDPFNEDHATTARAVIRAVQSAPFLIELYEKYVLQRAAKVAD